LIIRLIRSSRQAAQPNLFNCAEDDCFLALDLGFDKPDFAKLLPAKQIIEVIQNTNKV
jgi:hypothetical protein